MQVRRELESSFVLKKSLRGRRWPLAMLGIALGAVGASAYRLQIAVGRQLPRYVRARLEQALHRPVRIGEIQAWPPGAFTIRRLEVLAGPGETCSPLRAPRALVEIAWWTLISRRALRVREICLVRPQARL